MLPFVTIKVGKVLPCARDIMSMIGCAEQCQLQGCLRVLPGVVPRVGWLCMGGIEVWGEWGSMTRNVNAHIREEERGSLLLQVTPCGAQFIMHFGGTAPWIVLI